MKKIFYYRYYLFTLIFILFFICSVYFMFFKKIKHNDDCIWKDVTFIGHGMYGIDEIDYTNSLEALELGYNEGIRVMEVDFLFANEGKLILNHYWENDVQEDYNQFLNKKIKNKYTAMDLKMLLGYMEKYKDLYIVIDTKEEGYNNGKDILDVYKKIVSDTKEYNESLLDRFVIQLYNFDDLKEMNKIYQFKNKIFTIYKLPLDFNIYEIVYYCLFNDIETIVIPQGYLPCDLVKEEEIDFIRSKNINIYVNTVNDRELYNKLRKKGINGVYTDFLK